MSETKQNGAEMKTVRRLALELEEKRARLDECRRSGGSGTTLFYELHRAVFELQRELMKRQDPLLYERLYVNQD